MIGVGAYGHTPQHDVAVLLSWVKRRILFFWCAKERDYLQGRPVAPAGIIDMRLYLPYSSRISFMSSHTSRFRSGFLSRKEG